jgi:prepilin-type N-terminal cleavage/methylation domain-containing protein
MKRSGFTLTELVFVIAIIAVLAGIGVPFSLSMMRRARQTVCLQNLQGIGVGVQAYLRDNGERLPVLQAGRKSKRDEVAVMDTELTEYLGSGAIFHCPEGTKEYRKTGSSYLWNSTQNGRPMSELSFFGIKAKTPELIPIVSDKEAWHDHEGTNFLYADSSTSSKVRFATASRNKN